MTGATTRRCPECEAPILGRADKRYCSRACLGKVTSRAQRERGYHRSEAWRVTVPCNWCGRALLRDPRNITAGHQPHCDNLCAAASRATATSCEVPPGHPSRSTPVPADHPSRSPRTLPSVFVAGTCTECDTRFIRHRPAHRGDGGDARIQYCSTDCKVRTKQRRRRARTRGALGHFTRTQLLVVFAAGQQRCAYCDDLVLGMPDPDHVVALARGGTNDISNIVPACRMCNGDKRELSLVEWATDRALRGLPVVRTLFDTSEERFAHLAVTETVDVA